MSDPAPAYRGLTADEVALSRQKHGANVLTPPPRDPWWKQYLEKFDDPVIRILMIAAAIAIAVGAIDGHYVEGVGIIVAILLATFLAFWNEYRANKEFDILNKTNDDVAVKVLRGVGYTAVPRRDVVVGDVVQVEVGEEVPADGRVLEAVAFQVNEAKLTGEARPADKVPGGPAPAGGPAHGTAYGPGTLLRGTTVVDGYGVYEVTAVGDGTEIGRTLRESIEDTGDQSTLDKQLAGLSKVIGVVGFAVAVLTFAALVGQAVLKGRLTLSTGEWLFAAALAVGVGIALVRVWLPIVYDALELAGREAEPPSWLEAEGAMPWLKSVALGAAAFAAVVGIGIAAGVIGTEPAKWLPAEAGRAFLLYFMIAVTIIVVAVPEGLAMSVTLSLAYSMRKMTAANTLVRRMDACETIGAVTVICSDKTGTLTRNEMRVHEGEFAGAAGPGLPADPGVRELVVEAVAANTTAHLSHEPGAPAAAVGNPTEGALLLWLDAAGADYIVARKGFGTKTQWTFTTERKFMGTYGRSAALGRDVLHVKGAPEIVLGRCTAVHTPAGPRPLTDADRQAVGAALHGYQGRGMRTLGFAYHAAPPAADHSTPVEDLAVGMVWLGFAAIADPVRDEVPAAVAACARAGVGVKVVTGDNPETAREVARQIGLVGPADPAGAYLTGPEFGKLDDAAAAAAAPGLKVLSRARPADKLRLVNLLKEQGEVVAVTGDGVNDGPALNHADVGLAMGKTGTSVAKEASDVVLLDDSFGSITTAIRWGRGLYENIQRFILFQLTINVAALGLALLGPFIGFELPLTVMQMLWVNLIMDTFAALALATEPPAAGVLSRPPRDPRAFIVTRKMAVNIFATAGVFLAVLIGLLMYLERVGEPARSDAPNRGGTILFTVFVMLQFWNLFNAKMMNRSGSVFPTLRDNPSFLLIAIAIFAGQVLLVQFGGAAFRTVPLDLTDWLVVVGGTSVVLWIGELIRLTAGRDA
ncbi:MAG: calcium-translocating P-type ATPase, PMCA-type [Isosphaera sp.]|nr:calcium-translocating P-type ATPase, PMCA-type [Isosphaera sp.]